MVTLVNRAKVSTATTGTGTITLGAAESGYQSFADAGVVDTNVVRYVIEDGDAWEIGTGTYTATGTTLTRTVSESSNADAAISLTGSAVVYVGATAADLAPVLELYAENPSSPIAPSATGLNAVAIGSDAVSSNTNTFAVGNFTDATGIEALAVGFLAQATGAYSTAVGTRSVASGTGTTAIGRLTDATGINSVAIGFNAQAISGERATAITNSYASGTDSFAAAIANNTSSYGATGGHSLAMGWGAKATSSQSVSIGGFFSQATNNYAVTLGGTQNTASGDYSVAISGSANVSSGSYSSALGGQNNTASGSHSVAMGYYAKASTIGKSVFASGRFSTDGDAQVGTFVLRSDTTDATPEALTTNNSAAGTNDQIILPNNSAYSFSGTIIARQDAASGSEYASWEIKGALLRDGTAASTVLGNGIKNKLFASTGAAAWDIALTADTTNGGLAITVTGAAATNIRWVATVNTSEVTY